MTTYRPIVRLLMSAGVLAFLLATILSLPALAQTNKAEIVGTVTDTSGGVVPDATVKITRVDTGAERTVTSGGAGEYSAPLLDIGSYKVTVTKQGYKTVTRENIVLQTNDRLRIDVQLEAGEVSGEVTVTTSAPLVETESSDRGSVITGREVTELPLSGRNFTQLATLTPGVVRANNVGLGGGPEARSFNNGDPRAGSGGPGSSNPQGSSESSRFNRSGGAAISVNGQRATNNNFSLDGVDNNEPQFGTIGTFPNPDAIAEFKVTTSIPAAEVGRAAGAVINTSIKSGTNDFHGSLYYYGQNSRLNAYSVTLKTRLAEAIARGSSAAEIAQLRKAVQQIHEFGGTLGGPIIKNRTFFFFDFLGQRNNLPFPTNTVVPTALSRNGNFSEFPTIFNPFTGQPFPGNVINLPLDTVGKTYLAAYPLPTRNIFNPSGDNNNVNGNNYFTQRANKERINNPEIKIDHKVSDKNSLSGRFTNQPLKTVRANFFPGNIATAGFGAGEERGNSRQITINDTHTFSPTVLNEFRFGLTQIQISIFNCGVGGACGVSPTFAQDIGIPNANDGSLEASGGALIGNFGNGFLEFTGDGGLFQVKSKNPYFGDTVTIVKGNQVIKTGGELRLRHLNTIDGGRTGTLKGQFQYGDTGPISQPLATGQVCPAASTTVVSGVTQCFVRPDGIPYGGAGNGQANILLNLPAIFVSKSKIFGGPFNLRSQEIGLFVQDDWKVNNRLTLNLGLRYDLFLPFSEANGRYSLYSIDQRKVIVASGGGDRIISTDKNNFGPRMGFAYSLDKNKNLVLRGGYGLLYTLDGVDYPPGVRNPPFTNSIALNQNGFNTSPTATTFTLKTGPPNVTAQIDPNNIPVDIGVFAIDPKQKTAYVHQWQLSLQYQFSKDYSIDVGYVGNRSRNLLYANDIGSGGLALAKNAAGQFLNNAVIYTNGSSSSYDALQTQLQKRFSRNVQGQISYTWGHTIDNNTGLFNGLGDSRNSRGGPINPFNLNADRGNSALDVRHLLSANAIIDLPFGKGQRYLSKGPDRLLGGWQLNIIESARSGLRYSVVCSGCNGANRPTQVGNPFANVPAGLVINPAAFTTAASSQGTVINPAGNTIRFGKLGRNTFRGPAIYNTDFSVFKNTRVTEKTKVQLGFEFFNVFNHANFTVPQNDLSQGDFGQIKNNAYAGRVVQYRFKFIF
jgi:Carboxypeptidase regulatory-like domain/TonB dependent receptor